ncbi:MAG: V-type ATPase subunit [Chloroflexota bacterium]|nr:V-type ATPase subunit [Chloroflexota bacterium]
MPRTGYAFISAYLKGEEARLVASSHVERMLAAPSIDAAVEVVRDTDIGGYLRETPLWDFDHIDRSLWLYLSQCLGLLEGLDMAPREILKVVAAYKVKYDVHNAKAALRRLTAGGGDGTIPVGTLHGVGLLDRVASAETIEDIAEPLARCGLVGYADILRRHTEELGSSARARPRVDAELDREYYRGLAAVARTSGDALIFTRALGVIIDLANIQMAARAIIGGLGPEAADYIIEGGAMLTAGTVRELLSQTLGDMTQRLGTTQYRDAAEEIASGYERTRDRSIVAWVVEGHRVRLLKGLLAPRVLSPVMALYYLVLKEAEIRNMRLILKAMSDGIPVDETRNYLVLAS